MAIYKEDIVDIELESGSIHRSFLNHTIGSGDDNANRFGIRVFRNGEPEEIGGTCAGYFVRADGETVVISDGAVNGNTAYVTLPESCYAAEGQFALAIKISSGSITGTMRIVDGVVSRTSTEVAVDPGTIIPSVSALIATINAAVESIPVDYSALTEFAENIDTHSIANKIPLLSEFWEQDHTWNIKTRDSFPIQNAVMYYGAVFTDSWIGDTGGFCIRIYNASDELVLSEWYRKADSGTIKAANFKDLNQSYSYFKIEISTNESSKAITPENYLERIHIYVGTEMVDNLQKSVFAPEISTHDLLQDFYHYTTQNLYTPLIRDWVGGTTSSSVTYATHMTTHFPVEDKTLYMATKMTGEFASSTGGTVVRIYNSSDELIGSVWCNNNRTNKVNIPTTYPAADYFMIEVNTNNAQTAIKRTDLKGGVWAYIGYDEIKSVSDIVPQNVYGGSMVDITQNERLASIEENMTLVPAFYRNYADSRIRTINNLDAATGNHGDSFIFITDMHDQNNYYSPAIAKTIMQNSSVKTLVYGGDYTNEPATKQLAIDVLTSHRAKCNVADDVVFLRGNHDTNPYGGGALSVSEYYGIFDKHLEKTVDTDGRSYFCTDNRTQKIRHFYLDTGTNGAIDSTQQAWFAEKAAELESDWHIVVFAHYGIYTETKDDRENIEAYPVVETVRTILDEVDATVCCMICGHVHIDIADTTGDFPIIATTCDAHGTQASTYSSDDRTEGTINEQAFDVYHIDTTAKKVYVTRIGGGEYNVLEGNDLTLNDREFSYT